MTVFVGPMYSGKTESLLSEVIEAERDGLKVFLGIPSIKAPDGVVKSRTGRWLFGEALPEHGGVLPDGFDVYAIDEVQFLGEWVVSEIERVANRGAVVLVAGLDLDYRGRPFETTMAVMAIADYVVKLFATCSVCGGRARYSKKVSGSDERIDVDAEYIPVCRKCWGGGNGAG